MIPDVRRGDRRRDSWIVKGWIVMTWVVALGIFIPWQGLYRDAKMVKPSLTDAHVNLLLAFVESKVTNAEARGSAYLATEYVRDAAEIAATRDVLGRFTFEIASVNHATLVQQCSEGVERLYNLAVANEQGRSSDPLYDPITAAQIGVRDILFNFRPDFLPALPEREVQPSLVGAARRFGAAWLFSLIPAFGMLLARSKERQFPLWQEVILRPWEPLLAGVFWWYGFAAYAKDDEGTLSRRFQTLVWRFEVERKRSPNESEKAMLLREASGHLLTVEAALARVQAMPDVVVERSRRAAFTATIAACLSTPIQFIATVATTWAQSVRATASAGEAVEPKRPRGTAWMYFQESATRNGLDLGFVRVLGTVTADAGTVSGEYDPLKGAVKYVSVTHQVGHGVSVTAGRIVQPTVFDYPPPFLDRLDGCEALDLVPSFFDEGIGVTARRGNTTLQVAVVDGVPENSSLGLDARVEQRAGPLTLAASFAGENGESGREQYRAGFATFNIGDTVIGLGGADRSDLRDSASYLMAAAPVRGFMLSAKAKTPHGLTMTVERALGWKTRLLAICSMDRDAHPSWQLLFQQAVAFSGP